MALVDLPRKPVGPFNRFFKGGKAARCNGFMFMLPGVNEAEAVHFIIFKEICFQILQSVKASPISKKVTQNGEYFDLLSIQRS